MASRQGGPSRQRAYARLHHAVGDSLDEAALAGIVRQALAGNSDPTRVVSPGRTVVWDDADSQVVVHLDAVVVKVMPQYVVVSVDLESEQTGVAPVIVTYALGTVQGEAGLMAVTDEVPRGNAILVARWGAIVRDVVWAALLAAAVTHATERGKVATGVHALEGHLRFIAKPPVALAGVRDARGDVSPDTSRTGD